MINLSKLIGKTIAMQKISSNQQAKAEQLSLINILNELWVETQYINLPDNDFNISNSSILIDNVSIIAREEKDLNINKYQSLASYHAETKIIKFISKPGILYSGDVVNIQDHFYINLSKKTNEEGASQLAYFLNESGYKSTILNIEDINELRSSICYLDNNRVLITENLAKEFAFLGFDKVIIDKEINGIIIGNKLITESKDALNIDGIENISIKLSNLNKQGFNLSNILLNNEVLAAEPMEVRA